jgi:hypothetical protein
MTTKTLTFKNEKIHLKDWFRAVHPKHWILLSLVLVGLVFLALLIFKTVSIDTFFATEGLTGDYDSQALNDAYGSPRYSEVLQDYLAAGITETGEVKTIPTASLTGQKIDSSDSDHGSAVEDYATISGISQDVLLLDDDHSVTFTHTGAQAGIVHLALDFFDVESNISNTQISISVNGEAPFYESQTLTLPAEWTLNSTVFTLDRYDNEIQPGSTKIQAWFHHEINDFNGMHPGLFSFYLEPGDIVTIGYVNAEILIGQVFYVAEDSLPTYEEYLAVHGTSPVVDDEIIVSAREIASRNDPSIRLRAEQDPSNLYYDTQSLILNVIFGDTWQQGGQSLTYQVTVETSGYYRMSFKYRQYTMQDMATFREIRVDGEIPFDLLSCYAFPYTTQFVNRTLTDDSGQPLAVWLDAGVHTLTLTAVNYPYRTTVETLQYVMKKIQTLALNVKKYTSGGTDRYRDWEIQTYFPTAEADIRSWAQLLLETHASLMGLSTDRQPAEIANLKVAAERLQDIADDINALPSLMVQFSDGDSSVNQMLGNLMQQMMYTGLEIERTVLHGEETIAKPYANVFVRIWEGIKRLVLSSSTTRMKPKPRKKGN